ncbi:hypothetical protein L7F22_026000 [Adiantum nelumboides]|nr:hypothetical protein [Adiantum nelumboides]
MGKMRERGRADDLLISGNSLSLVLLAALSIILMGACTVHAAPITIPDLSQCHPAVASSIAPAPPLTLTFNCCLPYASKPILDFSFEKYKPTEKRIRRPCHTANEKYIAKYNRAYALMRALPDSDPRSLKAQADVHCSFCNGGYLQTGVSGDIPLQVHFSWLFLPWHRWYLYFHERILGELIGEPGFSLCVWNWDDQINGGNVMPAMFARNNTAIYDPKRNVGIQPPALVPLSPTTVSNNSAVVVNENLNNMYQSVVTASTATLFMGGAYRLGTDLSNATVVNAPLGGGLENGVHNGIHYYTGDRRQPLLQDMGTFTTASRDPIFYAHHSNVDRLWDIWRFKMPDGERFDHTDPDFLNAEFVFYDENGDLVKVKVSDALDNKKLGISYKSVGKSDKLWINYSPNATTNSSAVPAAIASGVPFVGPAPLNGTITLGTNFSAIVKRPTGKKPSKTLEVLNIEGVQVVRDQFVALLAFVNLQNVSSTTKTNSAEYLGTFNIVPSAGKARKILTTVKFEIGDNLKRIGIQNEVEVVISLLLKASNETVTIQGLKIDYE